MWKYFKQKIAQITSRLIKKYWDVKKFDFYFNNEIVLGIKLANSAREIGEDTSIV